MPQLLSRSEQSGCIRSGQPALGAVPTIDIGIKIPDILVPTNWSAPTPVAASAHSRSWHWAAVPGCPRSWRVLEG